MRRKRLIKGVRESHRGYHKVQKSSRKTQQSKRRGISRLSRRRDGNECPATFFLHGRFLDGGRRRNGLSRSRRGRRSLSRGRFFLRWNDDSGSGRLGNRSRGRWGCGGPTFDLDFVRALFHLQ